MITLMIHNDADVLTVLLKEEDFKMIEDLYNNKCYDIITNAYKCKKENVDIMSLADIYIYNTNDSCLRYYNKEIVFQYRIKKKDEMPTFECWNKLKFSLDFQNNYQMIIDELSKYAKTQRKLEDAEKILEDMNNAKIG